MADTWDPAQLIGSAGLSGSNLIVTLNASGDCVRSTTARGAAGGKWWAEFDCVSSGPSMNPVLGLKFHSAAMPAGGGSYLFGPADASDVGFSGAGGNKVAGGGVIIAYGTAWGIATGTHYAIGLLWDADAKTLEFFRDGVSQGIAWDSAVLTTSDWYVVAGKTGVDVQTITANFGAGAVPSWVPVGALAWDGSAPVPPPEPQPRKTTLIQNRAVSGAHALAQVSASVVAVAAYNSLRLVTFDADTGIASLGAALALGYQLGDIAKVGSVLMSVGDDGYLHKFSTAPAETGAVAVKARYPWIAVAGSFAIVHGGGGQIGVYNTSLTKLAQHSTGLGDVVYATADSAGNVYAFDGRGRGALLIVNLSTGALEFSSKFTAANAVGVRCAYVDEDAEELVIGCSVQSRVIVMNTATMGVTSSEMNPGKKLVGLVVGDPERRAIFETGNTEVFPDGELPLTAALTVAEDEVFFASSKMSAVGLYRTLLEE